MTEQSRGNDFVHRFYPPCYDANPTQIVHGGQMTMCFAGMTGGQAAGGPSSSSFGVTPAGGGAYGAPSAPSSAAQPAPMPPTKPAAVTEQATAKPLDVDLRDPKTGLPVKPQQTADASVKTTSTGEPYREGGVRAESERRRKKSQTLVEY